MIGNVELVCYTVKQEIFTLKIMRVKKIFMVCLIHEI